MNIIKHRKYILEYDTWEPFQKSADADMDVLISALKTKKLLPSCGNVKLTMNSEERYEKETGL